MSSAFFFFCFVFSGANFTSSIFSQGVRCKGDRCDVNLPAKHIVFMQPGCTQTLTGQARQLPGLKEQMETWWGSGSFCVHHLIFLRTACGFTAHTPFSCLLEITKDLWPWGHVPSCILVIEMEGFWTASSFHGLAIYKLFSAIVISQKMKTCSIGHNGVDISECCLCHLYNTLTSSFASFAYTNIREGQRLE